MSEVPMVPEEEEVLATQDAFELVSGCVPAFEVIPEDMELPQIKWGGSGAPNFVRGDEPISSFEAIIMAQWKQRAWYKETFQDSGGGDFPDCFSYDMVAPAPDVEPENKQADKCADCPMSAFGSHPNGRGQWCNVRLNVLAMVKHERIPSVVNIPVTSHKLFGRYITSCAKDGLDPRGMFTKFSLTSGTSKSGFKVALLNCAHTTLIAAPENLANAIRRIVDIANKILPGLRQRVTAREEHVEDVPY